MAHEEITIYVKMEMENGWGVIKLYSGPDGRHEIDGEISVGKDGAVITFARLPNKNSFWTFWNLTVHPLGDNEDVVDLEWCVTANEAVLKDTKAAKQKKKREFSYTLALEHEDGAKYYLDPKLVNTGGGGGG